MITNNTERQIIKRKSIREIEFMRESGKIAAAALKLAGNMVKVGATTQNINKAVHNFILSKRAVPVFLGYRDFPASICISINEEVIHGIPSGRRIQNGDIVSIDIGVQKNGYIGDCAATFIAGTAVKESLRLIETTKQCFYEGLKFARVGYRVSDISRAIQNHAEENGYSVVTKYVGHGVGSELHEFPEIPNYVEKPRKHPNPRLVSGMTIAIEPMVNLGKSEVIVLDDNQTVITADGKNSAHYEHTVLITKGDPEILTVC